MPAASSYVQGALTVDGPTQPLAAAPYTRRAVLVSPSRLAFSLHRQEGHVSRTQALTVYTVGTSKDHLLEVCVRLYLETIAQGCSRQWRWHKNAHCTRTHKLVKFDVHQGLQARLVPPNWQHAYGLHGNGFCRHSLSDSVFDKPTLSYCAVLVHHTAAAKHSPKLRAHQGGGDVPACHKGLE
jgi:hypothetical protein